jgi:hypothetical protein
MRKHGETLTSTNSSATRLMDEVEWGQEDGNVRSCRDDLMSSLF